MTLTDILIIYLAFGAPLAVYKYLQNRTVNIDRQIAVSVFTFFFWVPVAVEIGYLYLSNAYFKDTFVSHSTSDALDRRIFDLREWITAELMRLDRGTSLHDTRETVERYTGLAHAMRNSASESIGRSEFFEAAGRENYELGQLSLMRRNLHRLQRHHILARRDFVRLLEAASYRVAGAEILSMGIELARQLDDQETVKELGSLEVERSAVWSPVRQEQTQSITPPSIAMTASLNND